MTTITDAVSKAESQAISDEIKEAVLAILAKHNLKVESIKTGYGDNYLFKIEAGKPKIGNNGVDLNSKDATYFLRFGYTTFGTGNWKPVETDLGTKYLSDGIKLEAELGQEFQYGKDTYFFAGVNPRKKLPIVAISKTTGKFYALADSAVSMINEAANNRKGK